MAWRVARSLDTLLGQLNTEAPNRSKRSDGSIGDTNHLAAGWTSSDHNPWWPPPKGGVVRARDFTHDPLGGLDCHRLAERLVASRDKRIRYIIWNGRIADSRSITRTVAGQRQTYPPWSWLPYSGSNRHDKHLHLSVVDSPLCDDPTPGSYPLRQSSTRQRRTP